MGVDGARGRAQVGRRLLTSPPEEEPVDLPSAHSVRELARRLDARMGDGWFERYGSGISVRREPNGYRLTPRNRVRHLVRPQAFVRVVRDGDAARLTGVIRTWRPYGAAPGYVSLPLTVVILGCWAAMGEPGMAIFGLVLVVAGYAAERLQRHLRWDELRGFLQNVVAS